ncbi:MAG: signal peptidase I [Thermoleophilaceae bacterium]
MRRIVETLAIVAVALGLALAIQAFLVKPFRIPSESMVPTLEVGQRVLVDRFTQKLGSDLERGDVLVFTPPAGADTNTCGARDVPRRPCPEPTPGRSDTNFIKRVVGVGGDRLSVRDGRVYLNGRRQREPFANVSACTDGGDCDLPVAITIPEDHLYMMGDNRGASADSRVWGPVPEEWVIGQAFATYWPPDRIGTL